MAAAGKISIVIEALTGHFETDLNRASKTAEKRMKEIQRQASAAGKAIGVAMGTIAVAGMIAITRATIQAEKAQAQLEAALKSSGGASGQTVKSLNNLAASLQQVSTFDDDAISGAETILLQFRKIGQDVFPEATKATLDLATRMGVDLSDAATTVGKALENPITGLKGLKAAGVDLSKSQQDAVKHLMETGHAADAQRIVLKELEKGIGGAAAAARNTLGGALQALENSFGNLLEGDSGGDGVRGTIDAINEFDKTLNDPSIKSGMQSMIQGMAKMAEFAIKGIAAFGGLGQAIRDAFAADSSKSYVGLLAKRAALADDLTDAQAGGLKTSNLLLGGRSGTVNPIGLRSGQIASLQRQLVDIDKQLAQARAGMGSHDPNRPGGEVLWIDPPGPREAGSDGKKGGHAGKGHNAAAEAARRQAEAEKDLQRQLADVTEASKAFFKESEDLAAQVGGPLAQATLEYNRQLADLEELAKKGEVSAEALASAEANLKTEYDKRVEAIKSTKTPLEELIDQQMKELSLIGLTGAALQTADELWGKSAEEIEKYGKTVAANNKHLEELHKQIAALDEARSTFSSFFQDLAKNGISALDRLAEHIQDMILQQLGDQLAKSLFPDPGAGGSSGGGFWSNLLGSLFGSGPPGRASGGPVFAGVPYLVGEKGPELMIPRASGQIVPNHSLRNLSDSTGQTIIQNFSMSKRNDNRSERQIAQATSRALRAAR